MAGRAQLVVAVTLREWARGHVEFVDEHCWGPPPGAVARIAAQLVEAVAAAHERGLVLSGFGPDALRVTEAGRVRVSARQRPGSAAERAADLAGLGAALFLLATGIDLEPVPAASPPRPDPWPARLGEGNPCAAGLLPLVAALRHPDPAHRPGPAALRMLLTGRPPRTGTATVRLA